MDYPSSLVMPTTIRDMIATNTSSLDLFLQQDISPYSWPLITSTQDDSDSNCCFRLRDIIHQAVDIVDEAQREAQVECDSDEDQEELFTSLLRVFGGGDSDSVDSHDCSSVVNPFEPTPMAEVYSSNATDQDNLFRDRALHDCMELFPIMNDTTSSFTQ